MIQLRLETHRTYIRQVICIRLLSMQRIFRAIHRNVQKTVHG
jgi:hypothetical protein